MRIVHIVPSAFEYFDDIRREAFKIIGKLEDAGVQNEVFTLQYSKPSESETAELETITPAHNFQGMFGLQKLISELKNFDIVHLHCPFLGGGKKILEWKKNNPNKPLVLSYYRDVKILDPICLIIRFYNDYYLPKFFDLAKAVVCFSRKDFYESKGRKYLRDNTKLTVLAPDESIHLTADLNKVQLEGAIKKLTAIYKNLI